MTLMLILLHVILAISGLAYNSYLIFRPSKRKFYVSYVLVATTLVSGSYLVWSTHTPLRHVCVTGVAYLLFVTSTLIGANHRLGNMLAVKACTK